MKKNNNKGFTLAELLIVVAIIAVLVAIAIPVFTQQLERSREATDLSNIRAAYAEAVADYLASGAKSSKVASVNRVAQTVPSWQIGDANLYTRVDGVSKAVPVSKWTTGKTGWTVSVSASGAVTVAAK